MEFVERVISPMLPKLISCHNTIISYRDYQKLNDDEIKRFCMKKLGRNVRIIVKEDDYYTEEFLVSQHREKRKKSKTVILEII